MAHSRSTEKAAVIGDVIASRDSGDREALQQNLVGILELLNATHNATQPLAMTVGDEFQGLYDDLGEAFAAALRLRLMLMPLVEVRVGIGWGELTLVPATPPFGQDGPCWWRAREAIEAVKKGESSNQVPRTVRTVCRTGTDADQLLNGYLGMRDHIMSGFDDVDARLALMRLDGRRQGEMATIVGLSQSAVSRRLENHGLSAVLASLPGKIDII